MIRILILIYFIAISSVGYSRTYPNGEHLTDRIFNKTLRSNLIEKFNYSVYGYGGSSAKDFVRLISASIYCPNMLSQEELEDVFLATVETLLHAYNSNKNIRPLLVDYPLTLENLEISISASGANLEHPKSRTRIAYVPSFPYKLVYHYYDPITNKHNRTKVGEFGTYADLKARREAARGKPFLVD